MLSEPLFRMFTMAFVVEVMMYAFNYVSIKHKKYLWPRRESNLGLELRKLLYYPLYYEAIKLKEHSLVENQTSVWRFRNSYTIPVRPALAGRALYYEAIKIRS
jgi:hypothetical protein